MKSLLTPFRVAALGLATCTLSACSAGRFEEAAYLENGTVILQLAIHDKMNAEKPSGADALNPVLGFSPETSLRSQAGQSQQPFLRSGTVTLNLQVGNKPMGPLFGFFPTSDFSESGSIEFKMPVP